jgi:hypothetical protein
VSEGTVRIDESLRLPRPGIAALGVPQEGQHRVHAPVLARVCGEVELPENAADVRLDAVVLVLPPVPAALV